MSSPSAPGCFHSGCLDEVLEAQVGYLGNLNESDGLLLCWGVLQSVFAARQDGLLGVLSDADHQWEAKFVTVGFVQTAKGLVLFWGAAIETLRALIPEGFWTQQTLDRAL